MTLDLNTKKLAPIVSMLGFGGGSGGLILNSGIVLPTIIGEEALGGYFAGYISHNANGTATHGLIVAPKSSETYTSFSPGSSYNYTHSAYDGALNTSDLADGNHPAHDYCAALTTGGYNDWYLPAFAELEVAYGNLKPTTTSNTTSTFGTEAPQGHGPIAFNSTNYTSPLRSNNNTSSDPAQTSVSIFQSGGSQTFEADIYWTSNSRNSSGSGDSIAIRFDNGRYRDQWPASLNAYVRAFRKFAL